MTKIVLITGASTGFGRITAETLSLAGNRVFASMRDVAGKNRKHAEALRKAGIDVVELDVTDAGSVERALREVLKLAGRIDVLVNNAGIGAAGVSEAFSIEQAQAVFDVNLFGVLRVTRAVLPTMRRQQDGLVINIGSILGRVTFPFFGVYGASKFALEALSDSLRYELSQFGVDLALVQPSAYPTPVYEKILQPADSARVADYGKVGEIPGAMFQHFQTMFQGPNPPNPQEVADAVSRLIATPKGRRPARVVVGTPFGADIVNDQTAPVQAQVIEGMGLGHLAKTAA